MYKTMNYISIYSVREAGKKEKRSLKKKQYLRRQKAQWLFEIFEIKMRVIKTIGYFQLHNSEWLHYYKD